MRAKNAIGGGPWKGARDVSYWPIATGDILTARRRFRGIADMGRFSSRNDLQRMTHCGLADQA